MQLRRLVTTAALATLAVTSFAAPAQAQSLKHIDEVLDNLTCRQVFDRIHFLDLYEDDHDSAQTTRDELAQNINDLGQAELSAFFSGIFHPVELRLVQSQIAERTADKALDCGFVDEDPAVSFSSSQLINIPPVLGTLSSEVLAS